VTKVRLRVVLGLVVALGASSLAGGPGASPAEAGTDPRATSVSSDGSRKVAPPVSGGWSGNPGSGGRPSAGETNLSSLLSPEAKAATPLEGTGRESIIGLDNRTPVSPTTNFPARAIVLIVFDVPGLGSASCSGFMINPRTVATAGHCLAPGGTGGFFDKTTYTIYPGANGASAPYGGCTAASLFSVSGWIDFEDEKYDYGAINLNCTIGNTVGWLGIFYQSASPDLNGLPVSVAGYPGDKPDTQWKSMGTIQAYGPLMIYYDDDTLGGMSGGPVYRYRPIGSPYCAAHCARAIHTQGLHCCTAPHTTLNHGVRITVQVLQNLVAWINS